MKKFLKCVAAGAFTASFTSSALVSVAGWVAILFSAVDLHVAKLLVWFAVEVVSCITVEASWKALEHMKGESASKWML